MAQGTVVVFDDFLEYVLLGNAENPFDFGATPDVIKCAIVNNTSPPVITTANPTWGVGGTNLSTNEETGTNFPAGGVACASLAVTNNAGTIELDFGDPATWSQDVANPTACWWGVIYSDTAVAKECIGFVDLGGVFDATTGDLTITWGAPFATLNQA